MIMPSEPCDIYQYRAALLEWHQVHVGQTQRIYFAQDSSTLLQTMTDDVLRYANLLSHRYATAIDTADLSVIQRYFASGAQRGNAWNHEDIQQLLRTLLGAINRPRTLRGWGNCRCYTWVRRGGSTQMVCIFSL